MALTNQEAERRLAAIRALPHGTARVAAAEAIVRRFEAEGPAEQLPRALLDLVKAYTYADERVRRFVPFARLLRLWDASPELFDDLLRYLLFWEYKWVAEGVSDFPEVTAAQAEEFLAEMERRFNLAGLSLGAVANARFRWAWGSGDPDADAARLRWLRLSGDDMDDCAACRVSVQTEFFLSVGRWAEAVEMGLSQRGQCMSEPAYNCSALALACLEAGDLAGAVAAHRRMLATINPNVGDFATGYGREFELLGRGGHIERALLRLRDVYPGLLDKAATPLSRLDFLLRVVAGLSANLDQPGLATGLRRASLGTLAELHAWVGAEARALAARFDERNGNDYYARELERALGAVRAPGRLDLDAPVVAETPTPGPLADSRPAVEKHALPGGRPRADAGADDAGRDADGDALGEASSRQLFSRAESLAAAGDLVQAAQLYLRAADAADEAGLLADAGLALAESARCADRLGDAQAAHDRYLRAVPLLRAADAGVELIAQVLIAWAPVADRADGLAPVLVAIDAALARVADEDTSQLSDALAAKRRNRLGRLRASLSDTLARAVASAPDEPGGRDPIKLALTAGEEFAHAGAISDAAYAFWLAGQLQREAGAAEDALWSLESAFEGFTMVNQRVPRAEVAGEFIELLRSTGQFAKADEVVASLA